MHSHLNLPGRNSLKKGNSDLLKDSFRGEEFPKNFTGEG